MGLDMYLRGDKFVSSFDNERPKIDGFEVESYRLDLGYWRKFAPLHHFIVERFADGKDDCRPIDLSSDDLIVIADALEADGLPTNDDCHGFFFGNSDHWDEMRKDDENAEVFRKAAAWLKSNTWNSVEYQASW